MTAIKYFVSLIIYTSVLTGFISAPDPSSGKTGIEKKYESRYKALASKVSMERIRENVFYLSKDPLPRRVLNWSLPGHTMSSLEEADGWILKQLTDHGYKPVTDETRVRAFGRDHSKPLHHQYARPPDDAPWFTARNIIAERRGKKHPEELIIIIAHKDSQSWIESPGANDNAVGTCGALELAFLLKNYKPDHTIQFIFCNEEHTPWTSVTAANAIKESGKNVIAVINVDGIGVKAPEQKGKMTNVTRFTTPEGEKLADLMSALNDRFSLQLEQSKYKSPRPGDDDGSFINAGFPWSVLNIGSMPYGDVNYHLESDIPEKTDFKNAELTVKLTLAAILHLDSFGRP
jgi:hypothetical protein